MCKELYSVTFGQKQQKQKFRSFSTYFVFLVDVSSRYTDLEIQSRSSYYTVVARIWKISSKSVSLEVAVKVKGAILEI